MTPEDVQRLKEMEKRMGETEDMMMENKETEEEKEEREAEELAIEYGESREEETSEDETAYLMAEQLEEAQKNRDRVVYWLKENGWWENSRIPDTVAAHFERDGVSFAKLLYRLLDSLS